MQVIVDDQADALVFIELNPRFGGGFPLSWEAGARFPFALTSESRRPTRTDARAGLVMLRYDQAVFEDAAFFRGALP